VITRVWRGWAPAYRAQEYEQHFRSEVLPVLRCVAGFEGRTSASADHRR
jgi:hypothetical protein